MFTRAWTWSTGCGFWELTIAIPSTSWRRWWGASQCSGCDWPVGGWSPGREEGRASLWPVSLHLIISLCSQTQRVLPIPDVILIKQSDRNISRQQQQVVCDKSLAYGSWRKIKLQICNSTSYSLLWNFNKVIYINNMNFSFANSNTMKFARG